jgi:heme a synthase
MAVTEFPINITAKARTGARTPADALPARLYFLGLFVLGLIAFVFGIENRLTADGLFNLPPPVDWLPPFLAQDWFAAFVRHQQDPAFAACGGTESLAEFKMLYWWEWGRQASLLAVAGTTLLGLGAAYVWPNFRAALPRIGVLLLAALAYWAVRTFVDVAIAHVESMSSFNVGQYRHAVDVTFASTIVAGILASAIVPTASAARSHGLGTRSEWLWLGFILLDICFGALFAARSATAVWTSWPGYDGRPLPPLDRLFSYTPLWLNFTFNQYMIQLVHRALSTGLFIAALWSFVAALRRSNSVRLALVRFALITAQVLTGIATLVLGAPAALSLVHQMGSVFLLACSLVLLIPGWVAKASAVGATHELKLKVHSRRPG